MKLFAPAYGASLLALGGFVQMVLASTVGEGERRMSKRSSWWDSLGWAAISFGGGMAAVVPVADLFGSTLIGVTRLPSELRKPRGGPELLSPL